MIENATLQVTLDPVKGTMSVQDKRAEYRWAAALEKITPPEVKLPRARVLPKIDGDLGYEGAVLALKLTPNMVADAKQVDGPKDLSAVAKLLWAEDAVYLGVAVTDNQVVLPTANEEQWWEKDSIEFWIGPRQYALRLFEGICGAATASSPAPRLSTS